MRPPQEVRYFYTVCPVCKQKVRFYTKHPVLGFHRHVAPGMDEWGCSGPGWKIVQVMLVNRQELK
jgi:hypothetical protein